MWFKVDDGFAFHAKALASGNAACGLWVRAGSWAGQHLTDGFVPLHVARSLGKPAEARALVTAGLWREVDGGYLFHDWLTMQPSAADVRRAEEARGTAGAQANHVRWHLRRGVTAPDCDWCQDSET